MNLKWIGWLIFGVLAVVVLVIGFLYFKREKKKSFNLPLFLQEMVIKAEQTYAEIDDILFKDQIDGKIYQAEWFKDYDHTHFKKTKSQYSQFIIFTKTQDDKVTLPIFLVREGYLNIYLLMKEIEYSFKLYINQETKNPPKDSYLKFVNFLIFHGLGLEDLYFAPLKNEFDHQELTYFAYTLGMNSVPRPLEYNNLFNHQSLNTNIKINKKADLFYNEEFQKQYNLLEKILTYNKTELLDFHSLVDEKDYFVYDQAFANDNFGIPGIILNFKNKTALNKLLNLNEKQFEKYKQENEINLDHPSTNSIQNFYAYALKNQKTLADFKVIELDKKNNEDKKILNNHRFWMRLLNGQD